MLKREEGRGGEGRGERKRKGGCQQDVALPETKRWHFVAEVWVPVALKAPYTQQCFRVKSRNSTASSRRPHLSVEEELDE